LYRTAPETLPTKYRRDAIKDDELCRRHCRPTRFCNRETIYQPPMTLVRPYGRMELSIQKDANEFRNFITMTWTDIDRFLKFVHSAVIFNTAIVKNLNKT